MTTILAIARCSTKRQADKLSIPFQLTEMANFVRREFGVDTEVKTFIDAGVSGGAALSKREGLMGALAAMKKGDVLLSYDASRIARDTMLMVMVRQEVEAKGGRIMTVCGNNEDTAEARFMSNIMMAVAEFQKDSQNAKIKLALKEKKKQGFKLGSRAPYGSAFNEDRTGFIPVEEEQKVLQLARKFAKSLKKKWGLYTKLALHLNELGINSRSGGEWSRQSARIVFHKQLKA
jgi:DNA invertase Pin-like site-specific DNA recombinase